MQKLVTCCCSCSCSSSSCPCCCCSCSCACSCSCSSSWLFVVCCLSFVVIVVVVVVVLSTSRAVRKLPQICRASVAVLYSDHCLAGDFLGFLTFLLVFLLACPAPLAPPHLLLIILIIRLLLLSLPCLAFRVSVLCHYRYFGR